MKLILIVGFFCLTSVLSAQSDNKYVTTEVENNIYSTDFASSKKIVYGFVKTYNINIERQNESKIDLHISFDLTEQQYKIYDSLVIYLGYSVSKKVNTVNNYNRVREINLEVTYLKQKRDSYIELLNKLDNKSENYLSLWNEQKQLEEKIFDKERELINYGRKENIFAVSLQLNDEVTSPENTRVSFVNMPGAEYSRLVLESPKSGFSANQYQGYFLKYLFTKGKSFGTIGAYKSVGTSQPDSSTYTEMFILGFGQDFYSRHLGRGSRKFFNLYSGYTIGGIFATNKIHKSNMFYISPSIGLELFKNKFILIDTKVNYFVPLNNTRYLRGIAYNASFNFVF